MLRVIPLLAGLACIGGSPAFGQSTFYETDFPDEEWGVLKASSSTAEGSSSVTASRQSSGGNPDAYRATTHRHGDGKLKTMHLYEGAVYSPAQSGEIASIYYDWDVTSVSAIVNYRLLLRQGEAFYEVSLTDAAFAGEWRRYERDGLTPARFQRIHGTGPGRPDFSSSGAPMQFGYVVETAITGYVPPGGGPEQQFTSGIDNFFVRVNPKRPARDNQAPVTEDDRISLLRTETRTLNVLANDYDPDFDGLLAETLQIGRPPMAGVARIDGGQLVYTAHAGTATSDSLRYSVEDDQGARSSAEVQIQLEGPPGGCLLNIPDVVFGHYEYGDKQVERHRHDRHPD